MDFQKFEGSVKCAWHKCRQSAADTENAWYNACLTPLDKFITPPLLPVRGRLPAVWGLLAPREVDGDPVRTLVALEAAAVVSTAWNCKLGTSGNRPARDIACARTELGHCLFGGG